MNFDVPFGQGGIPTFKTDAEKNLWMYNRMLDGYLYLVDVWAGLSLGVDGGNISLEEMKERFDCVVAERGAFAVILDNIRKQEELRNPDKLVAEFRDILTNTPTAEEPKYDL